ncbi:hypothetical protein GCM10025787_38330 [Saccharopolyspora rosea]|uniref:SAV_915 family protein n=1 Tax=Saccharopolyspora rosea TaxID=524884 RepID=A0ABW3FKN5_9PSEU
MTSLTGDGEDEYAPEAPIPDSGDQIVEVFIPARADVGNQQVQLELRYTTEGALALVLYTSLERLVECCGEQQAWVKVPASELATIVDQVGAQVIREDVPLPTDAEECHG